MPIIISRKGIASATMVQKSDFGKEKDLQEYISQHPEAIPVYEIEEKKRLLVIAREFETSSGPIDALAVDNDGDIYVIETKLYANTDKRRVVAQVLDYGASLWKHPDLESFRLKLDHYVQLLWKMGYREKVIEYFHLDDQAFNSMSAQMGTNLKDGNFIFVVAMDSMDQSLKELISYVNQKSQFSIYGVELELYEHDGYEIVIPSLYGVEGQKSYQPPPRPPLTEEELKAQIRERNQEHTDLAGALFAELDSSDLMFKGFPTQISYGVDINGDFISLLSFTNTNILFSLPARAVKALGADEFTACKQAISRLGTFYKNPNDTSANGVLLPRYDILQEHKPEEFVAVLKEIAEKVREAMAG
ncbi:MAG: hypothetical protein ACLP6W_24085 [Bryobacteraceae bacterium]